MVSAIEPKFCPLCGSNDISTEYDNSGNGSYSEWHNIWCNSCGATGQVTVGKER